MRRLAAILCLASNLALAQGFPAKPIRLVVPFSAGGGADLTARIVAGPAAERLGQPIVIENRGGAGGTIGAAAIAKATPDGHTLLLGTANLAASVILFERTTLDLLADFAPVVLLARSPSVLAVHPSLAARSVRELVELAKARPGEIYYAGGSGSLLHLDVEYFKRLAGVDLVQVPYNGSGPAMAGVLAGDAPVVISPTILVLPHARSGRLRALAITSAERFAALPDLPTVAESGVPGYEAQQWYGILAPARTPEAVLDKLNAAFVHAVHTPAFEARLAAEASSAVGSTRAAFAQALDAELAKWRRLLKP